MGHLAISTRLCVAISTNCWSFLAKPVAQETASRYIPLRRISPHFPSQFLWYLLSLANGHTRVATRRCFSKRANISPDNRVILVMNKSEHVLCRGRTYGPPTTQSKLALINVRPLGTLRPDSSTVRSAVSDRYFLISYVLSLCFLEQTVEISLI